MNGDRPRKLIPPYQLPRRPPHARRRRGVRVPETLVEKTVTTAVSIARRDKVTSTELMPRRVQGLVHYALVALAKNKWNLVRLVLMVIGAAALVAGWVAHQLLAGQPPALR